MIAVIATLKVKDGAADEFEAVFRELAGKVRAQEPGNHLYQLARARETPRTYRVLELYRDQEALTAHVGSEHFREIGRRMGAALDGRPTVEYLDAID